MDKVKKTFYCVVVFCFLMIPVSFNLGAAEEAGGETVTPHKSGSQQEEASETGKPQISFDAKTYSVGEVWEGDVVSHDFIVQNRGTSELTIDKVKPG